MNILTRRNFVKAAAAASAAPLLGRGAFADEPLKVGYVYLGPDRRLRLDLGARKGAQGDGRRARRQSDGRLCRERQRRRERDSRHQRPRGAGTQTDLHDARSAIWIRRWRPRQDYPNVKFEHCTGYKSRQERRHLQQPLPRRPRRAGHDRGHDVEDGDHRLSRVVQGSGSRHGRQFVRPVRAGGEPEYQGQAGDDRLLVRSGQGIGGGGDARQSGLRLRHDAHRQPRRVAGLREEEDLRLRPGRRHVALRAACAI